MNTFWITFSIIVFILLFIEPIGFMLIRRTKVIYATDSRRLQQHTGDNITSIYLIEDDDDDIYLSDHDVPLFADIEISYKGFNFPQFGVIPKITNINKVINL